MLINAYFYYKIPSKFKQFSVIDFIATRVELKLKGQYATFINSFVYCMFQFDV